MRSGSSAAELVRSATVVVCSGPDRDTAAPLGSGFLVAQGRVLTCAHVIRERRDLWVRWHNVTVPATVLGMAPEAPATGAVPFPDAAVLDVSALGPHPTVALGTDPLIEGARLYAYGLTEVRTGQPEPDSSLLTYVGPAAAEDAGFLKLGRGDIAPGQSGGPLLNLDTGLVCGMVKQSLAPAGQQGGVAVPLAPALGVVGEDLLAANLADHDDTVDALRREQIALKPLPEGVIAVVRSSGAVPLLALALESVGIVAPSSAQAEDPQWVARQLFRLTLVNLVVVLQDVAVLPEPVAAEILWRVACCVPADDEPTSWWVPAEAALTVRTEWAAATPRVVAFESSYPATGTHLARRALCRRVIPVTLPPFTAETDPNGLPGGLTEAIAANLRRTLGVPVKRWSELRAAAIKSARDYGQVVVLDPAVLGDSEFLSALRGAFGGLYFLGGSRDAELADLPELVISVKPRVDVDVEDAAEQALAAFNLARG